MWGRRGRSKPEANPYLGPRPSINRSGLNSQADFQLFFAEGWIDAYRVLVYPGILIFQVESRHFPTLYAAYDRKPVGVCWLVEPIPRWAKLLRRKDFISHVGRARIIEGGEHGYFYKDQNSF